MTAQAETESASGVMVAAVVGVAQFALTIDRAAELASPHDQGVLQQAALLQVIQHALGTHTRVSRVQGGQLKAKREIRVASLFRDAPPEFLEMIVVHELAHLKEREHDKAFYSLCTHMAPHYHQWEFDCRLWLTARSLGLWSSVAEVSDRTGDPGSP